MARVGDPVVREVLTRLGARGLLATCPTIDLETSQHRAAGVIDLLTAAVAELNRATVLHDDGDVEHIATVSGQSAEWVVPRGTVG